MRESPKMSPQQRSVLIVDDNAVVRKSLRTMFETAGFKCIEAESGASALEQAEKVPPDLIVLDFSMPGMNGLEAAPLFKKKLPDIPILMFTMFANSAFANMAVAAGVSEVVSKEEGAHLMPTVELLLKSKTPEDR